MSKRNILVTGGTGIVGSELIRQLRVRDDIEEISVLVRGDEEALSKKERWLRKWTEWGASAALRFVPGDVSRPRLGVESREYERLRDRVDTIFHSAANTSFSARYEASAPCNLDGARHAVELAESSPRSPRLALVSTVFVAGKKTGRVAETDLDPDAEFSNNYEKTKAEAEAFLRTRDVDAATYRLSIVVGREVDGAIARTSGIYPIFGFLHRGLLSMVPGDPSQTVDLIPADVACRAIAALHLDGYASGATYHIASGQERSFTLEALLPATTEAFAAVDPSWPKRGYPLPVHVSEAGFEEFLETVSLVAKASLRSTMKQMQLFTRQLHYPKVYDNERTLGRLSELGVEVRPAHAWLPTVVARAMEMDFRAVGFREVM